MTFYFPSPGILESRLIVITHGLCFCRCFASLSALEETFPATVSTSGARSFHCKLEQNNNKKKNNTCIYVNISVLISRNSLHGRQMLHRFVACYYYYYLNNPQACVGPSNLPLRRDACLLRGGYF